MTGRTRAVPTFRNCRRFAVACVVVAVCAFGASTADAQTATTKLQWTHTEAPAITSAFAFALKVDAAAQTPLTAVCVAAGTGSSCTATIPALTGNTSHTLVLTASNAFGSTNSDPLTGAPPSKPTITITLTVTVP